MSVLDQISSCDLNKPYIFISYSSIDRDTVLKDVAEFQRRGYNIWLDDRNLDKTKDSWKADALAAIESYYCKLLVFYVSEWSLTSRACYDELCHTKMRRTRAIHNGEVGYIAIEVEAVNNIEDYRNKVYARLMGRENVPIAERQERAEILLDFIDNFFDTNNEKVRIHPRDEKDRKMDYYEEVTAAFPDSTKIFAEQKSSAATLTYEKTKENVKNEKMSSFSADKTYSLAVSAYNNGDHAAAYRYYKQAAEAGHVEAQHWLGYAYYYGKGIDESFTDAVYWYRKAAEQGLAAAEYDLGICYHLGKGVDKDLSQAAYWYRKAAEQDHVNAEYWLGNAYYYGNGVDENYTQAVLWWQKAAEAGHVEAQHWLGYAYYYGKGIDESFTNAVYWYRKAAEQGLAAAEYDLGICYHLGKGVDKDLSQAAYWYRKAAEQGHTNAEYWLGNAYYYGNGVDKDISQAEYWYRKAAEQGQEKAIEALKKF